jgi:hypothetical protein
MEYRTIPPVKLPPDTFSAQGREAVETVNEKAPVVAFVVVVAVAAPIQVAVTVAPVTGAPTAAIPDTVDTAVPPVPLPQPASKLADRAKAAT